MRESELQSYVSRHIHLKFASRCFLGLNHPWQCSICSTTFNFSQLLPNAVGNVNLEGPGGLCGPRVLNCRYHDPTRDVCLSVRFDSTDNFKRPLRLIHSILQCPQRPEKPETLHRCQPLGLESEIRSIKN